MARAGTLSDPFRSATKRAVYFSAIGVTLTVFPVIPDGAFFGWHLENLHGFHVVNVFRFITAFLLFDLVMRMLEEKPALSGLFPEAYRRMDLARRITLNGGQLRMGVSDGVQVDSPFAEAVDCVIDYTDPKGISNRVGRARLFLEFWLGAASILGFLIFSFYREVIA